MRSLCVFNGIHFIFSLLLFLGILILTIQSTESSYAFDTNPELGKSAYEERCLICHGREGDGKGLVGILRRVELSGRTIETYPRDFTIGVFRFRSTPTGCLPTDEDILKIMENGIRRSFMPSHRKELPEKTKKAIIEYLKTFSERWEEEDPCDPIPVKSPEWVGSPSSVEKGKRVYKEMKCWECHGYEGKGDGPKADKLKDDWGKRIWPFDFTTGDLKRGTSPENIYITFTTGLDGTGMPSYEDSLSEEDRWHLVSYTLKLMGKIKTK
jgi:mono/diheme cytochrome c family protein